MTWSFIPVTALPGQEKNARQVFVAYPYRLYPKADYRKVFESISKAFDVSFVFADEKISDLHILEKIKSYIRDSAFGIYDISGWNPNVTLELGLAFGMGARAYIAFDPSKTDVGEVPSDLRGMDRMQYSSYTELEEVLSRLMAQNMPAPQQHEAEDQLQKLRRQTMAVVSDSEGLRIGDISEALGVNVQLTKVVVRPLIGHGLRTEGVKKGTRYYFDPDTYHDDEA